MRNLIYQYKIDNHKQLNKKLLDFFDILPDKIGDQEYNLGISKFDGHNHISSPLVPKEWQYQDPLNSWCEFNQEFSDVIWDKLLEQNSNIGYKKIFLDAAMNKLHEHAEFHIQPEITELNYAFNIMHMWFHQMSNADYIDWDNHQYCQWSAVYFVEVPGQEYVTEFLNPEDCMVIQPKAEAGDMLIFPSWMLHRAPKMNTSKRKTVIAWNMDICYVFPEKQMKKLKQTHPTNWYK